jgi:hypothetical protein
LQLVEYFRVLKEKPESRVVNGILESFVRCAECLGAEMLEKDLLIDPHAVHLGYLRYFTVYRELIGMITNPPFFGLVTRLYNVPGVLSQVCGPVKGSDQLLQLMPLDCHVVGPPMMQGTLLILGKERLSLANLIE